MEIVVCTFFRVAMGIKCRIKTFSTMPLKCGGWGLLFICKVLEEKTPQRAFRMIKSINGNEKALKN